MELRPVLDLLLSELTDDMSTVKVKETTADNLTIFEITADRQNLSKIIGKKGKTAESLRHLMKCFGAKKHLECYVRVVQNKDQ